MNTYNYTTLDEVAKRLAVLLPADSFNHRSIKMWATQGLRMIGLENSYEPAISSGTFIEHTIPIPTDLAYLAGLAVSPNPGAAITSFMNSTSPWLVAKKHTGTLPAACQGCPVLYQPKTDHIVVNLSSGAYILAYLKLRTDDEGQILIPNDAVLIEALTHFVLYNYYQQKILMAPSEAQSFQSQLLQHLQLWQVLSLRAKNLNLPDLPTLENVRRIWTKLVPKVDGFNTFFSSLQDEYPPKS